MEFNELNFRVINTRDAFILRSLFRERKRERKQYIFVCTMTTSQSSLTWLNIFLISKIAWLNIPYLIQHDRKRIFPAVLINCITIKRIFFMLSPWHRSMNMCCFVQMYRRKLCKKLNTSCHEEGEELIKNSIQSKWKKYD